MKINFFEKMSGVLIKVVFLQSEKFEKILNTN